MNTQAQHSKARLVSDGRQWRIDGNIDYHTVVSLREQGEAQLEAASNHQLEIDFSSVGQVNTAALALLLCWHRKAQAWNVQLKYSQIPEKLYAIAEMSDLGVLVGSGNSNDSSNVSADSHGNASTDSSSQHSD